jgi:hypothetical protein
VACNPILGLKDTRPFDAPPPDAPPKCPTPGTAPVFSTVIRQALLEHCAYFATSVASDLAAAYCLDQVRGVDQWEVGPIAGPLSPITFVYPAATAQVTYGKLAPNGNELWMDQLVTAGNVETLSIYTSSDPTTWAWTADVFTIQGSGFSAVSAPATTPYGRRVLVLYNNVVHELEEIGAAWSERHSYTQSDLGVSQIYYQLNLSPDGLRMVFLGGVPRNGNQVDAVMYVDRADASATFGPSQALAGPPLGVGQIQYPFMSADCGRLYFLGLDQILYLEQA